MTFPGSSLALSAGDQEHTEGAGEEGKSYGIAGALRRWALTLLEGLEPGRRGVTKK